MRSGLLLTLAALIVVVVVEVVSAGGNREAGKQPPPLPTKVLQPPRRTLAELRGHPALINFWASWCEPCREEAPEFERFARSLHGTGALVGVDYTDEEGNARAFLRRYGWTFPVLSDPDGAFGARYGFSGLPTTVVLDSGGRIVETLRGPQSEANLRLALHEAARN